MGPSPLPAPGTPVPWEPSPFEPPYPPPVEVPFWRRERKRRYVVLFLLTLASTTLSGIDHYLSYTLGLTAAAPPPWRWGLVFDGLWYSLPVLAILGAHEFGHYFACVYYRVNASLPYFLPFPFVLTGTLGAVIRIRQPIPTKRALFDIGIAGPIAGFVVAVPLLVVGMMLSKVVPIPSSLPGVIYELGEPLLFKIAAWLAFGSLADGYTVVMHPIAFAAWFGLLATALNLFPIGQLDGGHISYAVFGPKSTLVTVGAAVCLVALTFVSASWGVWAALTIGMLIVFGPRHPRVFDEHVPLDRTRLLLAAFAVVMFVLCFTPAPLDVSELLSK